jgi:hypothetical protein
MKRVFAILLMMLAVALFSGCNPTATMVAEGGIGGTGIAMGRVAQIGSVYVNGVHYNTDNASFVVDGQQYDNSNSHIAVGMVVRVTGSIDNAAATGIAESVVYDSLLIGPVDALFDPMLSHIGVMGQKVHINADTVFENTIAHDTHTLDTLPLGALVEVSGFPDAVSGEILATRVVVRDAVTRYKVSGVAGAIDSANPYQFTLGGLTIDASAVYFSIPDEGTYAVAEGNQPPDTASHIFVTDAISKVGSGDGTVAADGKQVNFEGVITSGLNIDDLFTVNGQVVDASLTTLSGNTLLLAAGRIVEIKGVMNGSVLLAENIDVEASGSEREELSAKLENGAVDLAASTVTLMGQVVHVTYSTILENDHEGESTFRLKDLSAGDYIQAKVYDNNGVLTASKLEWGHSPSSYNASLEGNPTQISADQIEILGVTIDTSAVSGYTFAPDQRIKVRGNYNVSRQTLIATSITDATHDD